MGRKLLAGGVGVMLVVGVVAWRSSTPERVPANDERPNRFARVAGNPDAGEGARAKKEEGRVGRKDSWKMDVDRQIAENGGVLGASGLSTAPADELRVPLSQDWRPAGAQPTELTDQDHLSTFAIDVDTGSYTQIRRMLRGGWLPPAEAVRTEEVVNWLEYDYPEPDGDRPFSIHLEGAPHPWRTGHHLLRIGLQGRRATADREPVHLTFLVDTSCSMSPEDRLPLAKQAMGWAVDALQPDDTVAIATYAGDTRVVLEPTPVRRADDIRSAIRSLRSGGGTAMGSGLQLAYRMAWNAYVEGHENRVIVLSDGDANLGATSPERLLEELAGQARRGVTVSTVGFGTGNYRDALMERLADKGDGNYAYVDGPAEARRIFGEDLLATVQTIARDVKVQVEFDPESVLAWQLVGYENRAVADEDFRDDRVDGGEIGAGHTVTALYDVILRDDPADLLATVRLRYEPPGPEAPARELVVSLPSHAVQPTFATASADLRLAWGAAAFAEKLRRAEALAEVGWDDIASVVEGASQPDSERDDDLLDLVRAVVDLAPSPDGRSEIGELVVLGALRMEQVWSVVRRDRVALRSCYQEEAGDPNLPPREVVVKFTVAKDGTVSNASVRRSTAGDTVDACVLERFRRMRFPRPPGGGIAIITAPVRSPPS